VKPRGAAESFLTVFALGGLSFGILWKLFTGDPADVSTLIGLAFGAVAGLIAAPKLTETTVVRQVEDPSTFLESLGTELAERDIYPTTAALAHFRLYESKAAGSFSLGPVSVGGIIKRVRLKLEGQQVTIVGPRSVLSELGLYP